MTDHSLVDRAVEALAEPLPVDHLLVVLGLRPGSESARRALDRLDRDRRIVHLGDGRLASAARLVDGLVLWHRIDPVEASTRQVAFGLDLSFALPAVPLDEVLRVDDDLVPITAWTGPGEPDVDRGPTVRLPDGWEPGLGAGDLVAVTVEGGCMRLHRDGDPALPTGPDAGEAEAVELGRVLARTAVAHGSRFRHLTVPGDDPTGQWLLEMVVAGRVVLADDGQVVRALHRMPFREAVVRAGLGARGPVVVGPDATARQVETYLVGRLVARGVCPDHPEVFEACGILSGVLGGTVEVGSGGASPLGVPRAGSEATAAGAGRAGWPGADRTDVKADGRAGGAGTDAGAAGGTADGGGTGSGAAGGAGGAVPAGAAADLLADPFVAETMAAHLRRVHRWQAAEAEHRMRDVVAAVPGAPGPALVHAVLLLRQGRAHDAVALLDAAVAGLDDEGVRSWRRTVQCLARLRAVAGDLPGAISLLRLVGDDRTADGLRHWVARPPEVAPDVACPCGSRSGAGECCLLAPARQPTVDRVALLWEKVLLWSIAEECGWSVASSAMEVAVEQGCEECTEGLLVLHDVHLMEGDGIGQVVDEVGALLPDDEKELALRWRRGRHRLWRVATEPVDGPPVWVDDLTGGRAALVGVLDGDEPPPRLPAGTHVVAALLPGPAGHHLAGAAVEVRERRLGEARRVFSGPADAATVVGLLLLLDVDTPPDSHSHAA